MKIRSNSKLNRQKIVESRKTKNQFFKRISRKCRLNPHCNHAQIMRKMQLRSSFKKH